MFKILLVEADPTTRERYKRDLERSEYQVEVADSSSSTLQLVRDWQPDALVLDVELGRENGLSFLPWVLELRPAMRVILLSSHPGYSDDFNSWLADAWLAKGDSSRLVFEVEEQLGAVHVA